MASDSKSRLTLIVAVAVMLLAVYVGSYFATVVRFREGLTGHIDAGYPILGTSRVWDTFFSPMHWLDRRLRPHVWEPPP